MSTQQALDQSLSATMKKVTDMYSVNLDRSGIFFFANEAAQRSKQDISRISAGSTVGVVLLLLFVFRTMRALLLPITSVLLGIGFAFIVSQLIYGHVHVLTIVFGASLIGIVIDYSIHYFYHSAETRH